MNNDFNTWIGNAVSAGAITSALLGYMPAFAALIGGGWYLIQIYESATAQRWLATRRVRKLARMKARVLLLEASHRTSLAAAHLKDEI